MPTGREWVDSDLAVSEAYRHGRTQCKLDAARRALESVVAVARRKRGELYGLGLDRIVALAEIGLNLSADAEVS